MFFPITDIDRRDVVSLLQFFRFVRVNTYLCLVLIIQSTSRKNYQKPKFREGPYIFGTISLGIDVMRHRHERGIVVVAVVVVVVVGRSVDVDAAP